MPGVPGLEAEGPTADAGAARQPTVSARPRVATDRRRADALEGFISESFQFRIGKALPQQSRRRGGAKQALPTEPAAGYLERCRNSGFQADSRTTSSVGIVMAAWFFPAMTSSNNRTISSLIRS